MPKIKEFLQTIFNEFIYGGHLLSLGAASIVYTSSVLLNINITWDCLLIVYLGGQIIYLYNRYKEFDKDVLTNPERTIYLKRYLRFIPFVVVLYILLIIFILIYFKKFPALFFALFLLVLGLWYTYSLKNITRKIIGFKTIFVSLVWALLPFFLILYFQWPLNLALLLLIIFVFGRLFVSVAIFDIKDIESDKKEELLTLPTFLGIKKLIYLLIFITLLTAIPMICGIYFKILPKISLVLLFTIPYSFYYFIQVEKKRINHDFLYNVIVDGEFILWSISLFIVKFIIWANF